MATTVDDVAHLSRTLLWADSEVEEAEEALKIAKERARLLREETIPAVMHEIGIERLVLATGETVSIKQDVYASIPAASKPSAFRWLAENGFGGLIKLGVQVEYGKGDREQAVALYRELVGRGLQVVSKEDVNAQTLKAFLREQIAAGANIPLDLFGARPIWTTAIKSASKKK